MRYHFPPALYLLSIIICLGCNPTVVNLKSTNAKGEVQQLQNLIFQFDKKLAADSLLGIWDSTEYIIFEPAIKGRFRWQHNDELVFSPAEPLAPATSYSVTLTRELLRETEYNKLGKTDDLSFHTPELKIESSHVTWIAAENNIPVAQAELNFNYAVDPQQLKEKIHFLHNDQPLDFSILSLNKGSSLTVRFPGLKATDNDLETIVRLDKGAIPAGGVNGTPEDTDLICFIPSPFNLRINDIIANHDGMGGMLQVKTSQQISPDGLAAQIKIEPAVKFTVEPTDDGFTISSSVFNADKSYQVSFAKGMKGRIGGILRENYDHQFTFGELYPSLNFDNPKAVYLSAAGNRKIGIRIVNIPKVKVVVSRIYESNLLSAQRYGYYPNEQGQEDYYYDEGVSYTPGDVVYEKEIDTRTLPGSGSNRIFSFDMDDQLAEAKGIYHIKIRSASDYWVSDSRFISRTDLGIIAKEGHEKLLVFVNSIKSAESVTGAQVIAYGNNNQVLGTGSTDASGTAEITYSRKEYAGFKPAMVIVKTAGDFNYLPFSNTRVNTSRFEVGGKKSNSTGLETFIYEERDIYRPGEKINFSVIIRDRNWQSPGQIPVKLKFIMPNGRELRQFRKTLNEEGSLEASVDISASAITGSYTMEVFSSTDVLLGSKVFNIEEFIPDRIKVDTKLDKTSLKPGETTELSIMARNFFGTPAAQRNYEAEVQIRPLAFNAKKYSGYSFALDNEGFAFDKILREGKTSSEGAATERFEIPSMFKNSGLLQALFYTTVFDETGRPVSTRVDKEIYTQDIFLGIKDDGYNYFPLGQQIKFPLIAVNKDGNAVAARAMVRVIKHEYRTVLSKSGGYFRYDSQRDDKIISETSVNLNGENSTYGFIPASPGNYELRVYVPGAAGYVKRTFYSYGHWGGDNNSFEVNTEGQIDISTDKIVYAPGDKLKVLFKTPFSGKMLITLETDKVISHEYVNVENRTASIDLNIKEEYLPNIYITATLIKPHTLSDIPLTVAYGFQGVKVELEERKNNITILAAEKSRSATRQEITVKAEPGSFVTLAAVDNGVLQVSNFKTPDPYLYFYAPRALEVAGFNIYPLLFPEIQSSTGGDSESEMKKRVNPMPSKRVKILSYWSGIKKTNGRGEAKFMLDIPSFSGEVRLMAVAYKGNSFGSREKSMIVADPIVVSTALPRFLSPSDTLNFPVTVTNTTSAATNAKLSIKTDGAVTIAGTAAQTISLPANAEKQIYFNLVAANTIGNATINVDVQVSGENFINKTELSIRPVSPLQKRSGSGSVTGGQKIRIDIPYSDLMKGSATWKLVVGRSPVLDHSDLLNYLLQYPYGCTEQVISAAFPQLYFNDLAKNLVSNSSAANVQEAIKQIKIRQLYNGGILLWEGSGTAHWWTTVYAAHFCIEAAKAGYDIDESLLSGLLGYINSRLKSRELINYSYNRDQQKKIAPKEVAYSLYVLALASRPDVPSMNYYKAKQEVLSLDSRYLLSAAYALAGDRKRFAELLPSAFSGEESTPQTGGSFYSDIRDEAIALNVLIDVDPGNAQIPVMARHVSQKLKQRQWYSTQEAAFSFLALGKIARRAATSTASAELRVNGKKVGSVSGEMVTFDNKILNGNPIELVTTGQGQLYYYWEAEGISATGEYVEEDNYIKVRRKFFDRNGRQLNSSTFKQNDLIIVQLTLDKTYSGVIDNVVITDILPAGFEIENPRTREIPGMDWIKDASTPVSLDVRDDRINLFDDLKRNRQVYYYAVRAVSTGQFKMGPVSADAMYNGEYHSYHGAGTIIIR